jgi:ABC-type antimicrobial peptide transport system permease subunit
VAKPPAPTVFLPYPEHPGGQLSIVLRSALAPASLVTSVKQRLRSVDSSITVTSVRPLDAIVGVSLSRPRFTMLLAGVFAILALALSIVGVFGSVSFFVTSRTHEIGIRLALGARAAAVRRLVVADGLRPVVIGVVAGGAIAAAGAHAMEALLYEVGPLDPLSFAIGAAVLIVAATAAALIPANRAVRIDPLRSLRND